MKNVLLIYNPRSGSNSKRPALNELLRLFPCDTYNIQAELTTARGSATELVRKYGEGKDSIVVCGGDGTLHEAINGFSSLRNAPAVGYIPIGSTNDYAVTVGIPTDYREAVQTIVDGHTSQYDTGVFNDKLFSYVACFGAGTSVSYSTPQALKNVLGYSAYMINGFVIHLIPVITQLKPQHIKIEYDGITDEDDFYFGSVSNAYSVAGMFKFSKDDVKLNDGLYELLLVKKINNAADFLVTLRNILKGNFKTDKMIYVKAHDIKMTFDKPSDWSLDGEEENGIQTVEIHTVNKGITVFTPEGTVR